MGSTSIIKSNLSVFLSLLAGLVLTFIQLPDRFFWLQPQFMVLIIFCLVIVIPLRVNVGIAWGMGILLDVIFNIPIGTNPLLLVLFSYLLINFRERFLELGFLESALVIFIIMLFYEVAVSIVQIFFDKSFNCWSILGHAFTSALIWPFLAFLFFGFYKGYKFENNCG